MDRGARGGASGPQAVTAFVDTNVLVRHLTGEPAAQARRATAFLDASEELFLADLIVAETVYVLGSFYEFERTQIADGARAIVADQRMVVADRDLLLRAIEIYEVHRIDFAEAYLVAAAEVSGVGAVASFDRSIDRVGTITRIEP